MAERIQGFTGLHSWGGGGGYNTEYPHGEYALGRSRGVPPNGKFWKQGALI